MRSSFFPSNSFSKHSCILPSPETSAINPINMPSRLHLSEIPVSFPLISGIVCSFCPTTLPTETRDGSETRVLCAEAALAADLVTGFHSAAICNADDSFTANKQTNRERGRLLRDARPDGRLVPRSGNRFGNSASSSPHSADPGKGILFPIISHSIIPLFSFFSSS